MIKHWTDAAWEDYIWWQNRDKKIVKRINQIIKDIERSPFSGLGKPEPLRWKYSGTWSRRIDQGNRIIYSVDEDGVTFHSLRDHYSD